MEKTRSKCHRIVTHTYLNLCYTNLIGLPVNSQRSALCKVSVFHSPASFPAGVRDAQGGACSPLKREGAMEWISPR